MGNTVKILIGSEYDGKGFSSLERDFEKANRSAKEFIDTLKMGVGIDLGGRIVASLAELPAMLQEAITNGVRLNAELETTRLTIAGMVKQFGGLGDFNQGLAVSDQLIAKMRESANALGISFEALMESYKTTAGAMFNSGVRDLQKQIDLTVLLQRAMAGLGISGFQATRDIQDIFTGMAERTKAGRELGLHNEDIKKAEEQGRMYEFLTEKLSGFAEAGAAGMHTFSAESARLENQFQALERELSRPIFEALKEAMAALNSELSKPEVAESMKELGIDIAMIVASGAKMVEWAVENIQQLKALAIAAGLFGVALAAVKLSDIVFGLGLWAQGIKRSTEATAISARTTDRETESLTRNTRALEQNAAARIEDAKAGSVPRGSLSTLPGTRPAPTTGPTLIPQAAPRLPSAWDRTLAYDQRAAGAEWRQALKEVNGLNAGTIRYNPSEFGASHYYRDASGAMSGPMFAAGAAPVAASPRGSSVGAIGGSAKGMAGMLAYGELAASVINLIDALNQLRVAYKEAEETRKGDDIDNAEKIYKRIMSHAQNARPEDQADLQRQVAAEKMRLESILGNETDVAQQRRLRDNIDRLNNVLVEGSIAAEKNAQLDIEAAARKEKEDKWQAEMEQHAEQDRRDRERGQKSATIADVVEKNALADASPHEKLLLLRGLAAQQRSAYQQAFPNGVSGLDAQTADPMEMAARSSDTTDVAGTAGSK